MKKSSFFSMGMKICLVALGMGIVLCIVGPWVSEYDYKTQNLGAIYEVPSLRHYLGTDSLGRDVWVRLLWGGRVSLVIAFVATTMSVVLGTFYGMVAGYVGTYKGHWMMRLVDTMTALPYMMLVIVLMAFLGRGLMTLLLAIAMVEWLMTARIVRSLVIKLKNSTFIHASQVLGQSFFKIILKHCLPNIVGVSVVCATMTVPSVILLEAMLSFLGLGVQPPMPSLGEMIAEGVRSMEEHPWLLMAPASVFSGLLFCIYYCGDCLRDFLDVRLEQ